MAEGYGSVDPNFLAGCLSDHETLEETGWSVCAHGHGEVEPGRERGGSVSSEIMQPALGTMHYAYGWPCGGEVDYPGEQPYQDRSWGRYMSFRLGHGAGRVRVHRWRSQPACGGVSGGC